MSGGPSLKEDTALSLGSPSLRGDSFGWSKVSDKIALFLHGLVSISISISLPPSLPPSSLRLSLSLSLHNFLMPCEYVSIYR